MNTLMKPKNLPLTAAWAGLAGNLLRRALYGLATDDTGLLVRSHPLELGLWLLTGAVFLMAALGIRKAPEPVPAGGQGSRSLAVSHILGGACFALTVLTTMPMLSGPLGTGWKLLGLLSFPCLLAAGLCRVRGKVPFFGLYMVPCLFLVLHIVNHYQLWSGNPQVQDYVFELLATIAMMFFAYHCAAASARTGKPRMHLLTGILALYLCLTAISRTEYLLLHIGSLLWAQSGVGDLLSWKKRRSAHDRE